MKPVLPLGLCWYVQVFDAQSQLHFVGFLMLIPYESYVIILKLNGPGVEMVSDNNYVFQTNFYKISKF